MNNRAIDNNNAKQKSAGKTISEHAPLSVCAGALAAGAGLGAALEADAVPIVREIGVVVNQGIFDLDVDEDGVVDFTFSHTPYSGRGEGAGYFRSGVQGYAQVNRAAYSESYGGAERLGANAYVDNYRDFSFSGYQSLAYGGGANTEESYGAFQTGGRGYLGLTFDIPGGSPHYAWAAVDVNPQDFSFEILRVGWESEAETPLRTPVPTPATLALLAAGAGGLLALRRRRARTPKA